MRKYDSFEADDLKEWREGFTHAPGTLEVVANWVGFDQAMVTWDFMWPDFVQVDGCVLLPWEYSLETFDDWWSELSGDRTSIESAVNHLHLWDMFGSEDVSSQHLAALGERIAKSWSAALADQFPERYFEVMFDGEDADYGPTVSIVSGENAATERPA